MISVVFSKDRACQLHNLLESIPKDWPVSIIYTFSSSQFEKGYKKLQDIYNHEWIYQENLTEQFLDICKRTSIVGIITDDSWFYKTPLVPYLNNVGCYTTRMGFNTIIQDPFKQTVQPELTYFIDDDHYISWNTNFYHQLDNYGFMTSMDGHYYHAQDLLNIIDFTFNNPSQFETKLFYKKHLFNHWMRSEKTSSLVNIPLNTAGGYAEFVDQNIEEINDIYLNNKRIKYITEEIKGCHQILNWEIV